MPPVWRGGPHGQGLPEGAALNAQAGTPGGQLLVAREIPAKDVQCVINVDKQAARKVMVSETEEEVSGTWTSVSSAGIPRGAAVQCGGQSAPSAGPSDSGASAVRSAKVSDGAGVSVSGGASVSSGAWVSVSSGASVSNSDSVRSTVSGGGGRSTESEISRTPGPDGRIPGLVCGVKVESERMEPVSEDGQTQHDSWPECDLGTVICVCVTHTNPLTRYLVEGVCTLTHRTFQ